MQRMSPSDRRHAEQQRQLVAECRADSCLDPTVPLGAAISPHPLEGPTVLQYYRDQHRRGHFGIHEPLYQLAIYQNERIRHRRP
jgi:hypothetical protein